MINLLLVRHGIPGPNKEPLSRLSDLASTLLVFSFFSDTFIKLLDGSGLSMKIKLSLSITNLVSAGGNRRSRQRDGHADEQ